VGSGEGPLDLDPEHGPDDEAKFWLEPEVCLAFCSGLDYQEQATLEKIIQQHREEFIHAWNSHFSG